jgi:SNF family Na+-dependent transporter
MTGDSALNVTASEGNLINKPGLGENQIWIDAVGQVFFSIGTCMGVMTVYGSYNPPQ